MVERAADAASRISRHQVQTVVEHLRGAKVGDLDLARLVDQHVVALQITVDCCFCVQVAQSQQDLPRTKANVLLWQTVWVILNHVCQAS